MSDYKLIQGQKLIKEIGNFLYVQQNKYDSNLEKFTDELWFKYYIHKKAVNNYGNFGVINIRDKNIFTVFGKDFEIITYKKLEDAFNFVENFWIQENKNFPYPSLVE
jgi:hypothetical protein